jgi:translocation and assembly module TamB
MDTNEALPPAQPGQPGQPLSPQRRPRPLRRRALWSFAALAAVCALLSGLVVGLYWAAGTTGGSAWLLARLALIGVKVQVTELEGTLRGDFKAQQVVVTVGGTRVEVDRPAWRALSVDYAPAAGMWARIHVASLVASRVAITVEPGKEDSPFKLPSNLHLPVELQIDDVQAGELHVPGLAGHPLRDVRGQAHLGADRGRAHRFERLSARIEPLSITGHARIDATGPMALDVDLQAVQSPQGQAALPALPSWAKALRTDWRAQARASGPLAAFDLRASLRAQGQKLDATAQVVPEAAWALPKLEAQTEGLDLSALLQQAPLTALNGTLRITPQGDPQSGDKASTLALVADLANTRPGRWDLQHLPVKTLAMTARWRTDQAAELVLDRFEAALADDRRAAGTVQGHASWKGRDFSVDASFDKVQPSALDSRLMAMTLSGPVKVSGTLANTATATAPRFTALAELSGQLVEPKSPVQLRLDATGSETLVELRELRARAGGASATLSGTAEREREGWQLKAKAALVDFDPKPWFPAGPRGGWRTGTHRFNLHGDTHLHIADSVRVSGPADKRVLMERLAGLTGEAQLQLDDSALANVPLSGSAQWRHAPGGDTMQAEARVEVGGNRVSLDGQFATDARGQKDRWALQARAPTLARVAPLLRAFMPSDQAAQVADTLAGSLSGEAQARGRWPDMSTQGNATLSGLRAGPWSVGQGQARWQASGDLDAPLDVQVDIGQAAWSDRQIGNSKLQLSGTGRNHQLTLNGELRAAPPVWMETLQGGGRSTPPPNGGAANASPANTSTPGQPPERAPLRTLVTAAAQGSLAGNLLHSADPGDTTPPWSWKGMLQRVEMRTTQPGAAPLLAARDIALALRGGPPLHAVVGEGRADILGAALKWSRIEWEAGRGVLTQQLDMQAELEPLAVAPLLRRVQPNFGWGGDLVIAGRVAIKQTDSFSADIVLERVKGDLTVTEESGTQALGLTDLRIGLDAKEGVWNFTAGLAGETLGVLGGALIVRTSPQAAWPAADAPVQGVLEAQVANLGTWGAWVPAGWRLDGRLNISASLGGHFNAPEYTGKMVGSGIGARNMVEGINVTDGEVDISLQGDTARINTFKARGGSGIVRIEGDAKLDDTWRARLKLVAEKFQVLGRVDLRVVTTGEANVTIEGESVKGDGRFTVDEGLIDFTRLSSPGLSDDVIVTGRSNEPREAVPTNPNAPGSNRIALDLQVNLGDNLRMRGLGIDTLLRGDLRVSRPGGKWALIGKVSAVDGTFANYGQKLVIDRGIISFSGAPSDMFLDFEATRPNLDVRVGVQVTGPLQNLRVKLFSVPDMTNNEKLSWLMLGRASDGLGKADTALVQRAAFALLAGEGGGGGPGAITRVFGIDDLGLRQTDGDTRETVVSVGKQLSKRVYVAYEQNLATSAGSFQVTYRIAQRFVMRLQSGFDRSIDLIGTWRWE